MRQGEASLFGLCDPSVVPRHAWLESVKAKSEEYANESRKRCMIVNVSL